MPNTPTGLKTAYQAELEGLTADLARLVNAKIPESVGMALFLFDYGPAGFIAYASTGQRADMVRALKEWLERAEAEEKAAGGAS